jgi:hypothetical protein
MIVDFDGINYELNEEDVKVLLELADELSYLVEHNMPYPRADESLSILRAADAYRQARRGRARRVGEWQRLT